MKKFYLFLIALFTLFSVKAAGEPTITLTTSLAAGSQFKLMTYTSSVNIPFTIDWGDGNPKTYSVDPDDWGYAKWTTGTVQGEGKITITGPVTMLNASELEITSCTFENVTTLTEIDLSKNKLTALTIPDVMPLTDLDVSENQILNSFESPNFNIENVASTLDNLNVSNNNLTVLNLNKFSKLEYFTASDNPSLTTVVFYDGSKNLKQISMSNCDIVHFYAITLPNLTKLELNDNSLAELEDGTYPKLTTLLVANNMIKELNLTKFPELYSLYCNGNQISDLNLANNPLLNSLNCSDNPISSLDLSVNTELATLIVSGTDITKLDISKLEGLRYLTISDTNISNIDLTNAKFLNTFTAQNTKCEFFYFNYVQPEVLTKIDIRNNKYTTANSLNAMYKTIPVHKELYDNSVVNLLLSGCNGVEQSDTSWPNSQDMQWKTDVNGDGSVKQADVDVTVKDADSGEKVHVTGYFGGNIVSEREYDFTKYNAENGSYYIAQWTGDYYQELRDVTNKAELGAPMMIVDTPNDGYKFKSVTVNGREITEKWFVVSAASEIKVNFEETDKSISFTTGAGQELSFALAASQNNTTVEIDWGTGSRQQHKIGTGWTRIDGVAAGAGTESTVTIYGDVVAANFESWGEYGEELGLWNNKITGVDVSKNSNLAHLNLYMNPIGTLDVSNLTNLYELDCSYCELNEIDVTKNTQLVYLACYGNNLTTLDVSKNTLLEELNAKVNSLSTINLLANTSLVNLNLANNKFTSIDLSKLVNLTELNIMGNLLTDADFSKNTNLVSLNVGNNGFSTLNLDNNTKLESLSFDDNNIHALDLSKLTALRLLDCGGNGMTACELDDFYFTLPYWQYNREPDDKGATLTLLTGNEANPNDVDNSDTAIAVEKNWIPSKSGNASGCDVARVIIEHSVNGTIVLKDAEGNEIKSGDKAKKNSPITIESQADSGYKLDKVTANGIAVEGNTFKIARLTKVLASFVADEGGVDSASLNGVSLYGSDGAIVVAVASEATVDVYSLAGASVLSERLDGNKRIAVAEGTYVVRVSTAEGTMARVVVVR